MQFIGTTLSSALNRALSDNIHPTKSLLAERFLFAAPITTAGALVGAGIANTLSHEFLPVTAGGTFGVSLALINTITSMACKALYIGLEPNGFGSIIKIILDIALAVLATYALSNLLGFQLTVTKTCSLIPTTIISISAILAATKTVEFCAKHLNYVNSHMESAIADMSKY